MSDNTAVTSPLPAEIVGGLSPRAADEIPIGTPVTVVGEVCFGTENGVRHGEAQEYSDPIVGQYVGWKWRREGVIKSYFEDYDGLCKGEWINEFKQKRSILVVQWRQSPRGRIIESLPTQVVFGPLPTQPARANKWATYRRQHMVNP